mmetsp:Transcript_23195/g.48537  ORF Transcript_23195/g.48537 Transcript_23195/m.48537 type:complete len:127 (+) Transcript_23195:2062-2442(+)
MNDLSGNKIASSLGSVSSTLWQGNGYNSAANWKKKLFFSSQRLILPEVVFLTTSILWEIVSVQPLFMDFANNGTRLVESRLFKQSRSNFLERNRRCRKREFTKFFSVEYSSVPVIDDQKKIEAKQR